VEKIIITGVGGFIGSNLAASLLTKGCTVIGIDNLSTGSLKNLETLLPDNRFTFVHGDILNPFVLREHKGDVVVHLASQKIPRYTHALRTLEENQAGLKNVIDKCVRDRCKLVYASTSDVYGKNPHIPFREDSDLHLGPTTVKRWAYAVSKIYGEQLIRAYSDETGIDFTICRFFGSFGPHQNRTWWGGPQAVFISNALRGVPLEIHGDGTQQRTFTYISDTIGGLIRCVIDPKASREIFNVAGPPENEITIKDLAVTIWHMINPRQEPLLEFKPYAAFGTYEDVQRRVPDNSKIHRLLGFTPQIALQDGLEKTIHWQRGQ
jgi:UDP-glucose 4-epimerase